MSAKTPIHGRNHRPGGPDPIPGLGGGGGGGGGIDFDTYPQAGGYLYVEANGAGIAGIDLALIPTTGYPDFNIYTQRTGLNSANHTDLNLWADGNYSRINMYTVGTNTQIRMYTAASGFFDIAALGTGGTLHLGSEGALNIDTVGAGSGNLTISCGSGDLTLFAFDNVIVPGLPTADPGIPGALWNSSGTVKVSL